MGSMILETALEALRGAGFPADAAYPGQKRPEITGCAAAVHIGKVDRAALTVALEVSIVCPGALGGDYCETEALRAAEALRKAGAGCVQRGCVYDGMARLYTVAVEAVFTGCDDGESWTPGPGFSVFLDDVRAPWAVSFQAEQKTDGQAWYAMGENAPVGTSQGSWLWEIRLEELIPVGTAESDQCGEEFQLKVAREAVTEVYSGCCWTSVRREFTKEGLRRVRSGIALGREETDGG